MSLPVGSHRRVLPLCVLVLAGLSFLLASQLPLYTDEITWTAILGRMDYDHGRMMTATLQPSCSDSYARPVASIFIPARWLDIWLFRPLSTPWRVRAFGLAMAGAWLSIVWFLLVRLLPQEARMLTAAGVAAWSTLGVMPFLLVMKRPEQVLLVVSTVLLLLSLKPPPGLSFAKECALAGFLLAAGYWVLCAHPRGHFLVPLLCCCGYRLLFRVPVRAVFGATVVWMVPMVWAAWQPLWSCAADPLFNHLVAYGNFNAARELGLQHGFRHRLGLTLLTPAGWGLRQFVPKASYTSDLIPAFRLVDVRLLRIVMEVGMAALLCFAAVQFARCLVLSAQTMQQTSLVLAHGVPLQQRLSTSAPGAERICRIDTQRQDLAHNGRNKQSIESPATAFPRSIEGRRRKQTGCAACPALRHKYVRE